MTTAQLDAITTAYAAGTIAGKGTLFIEGIGSRSNNWGVRATLSVKGTSRRAAREAVEEFVTLHNADGRNRNGDSLVVHLTKLNEVELLGDALGIGSQVRNAIAEVYDLDRSSGRHDQYRANGSRIDKETANRKTIVLKDLDAEILDKAVELSSGSIDEDLTLHAFVEGSLGLSLGSSDLSAVIAGEGILDRYSRQAA